MQLSDFAPSCPNFQANPFPTYELLRNEAPVHARKGESGLQMYDVTRYEDVLAMLRDPRSRTVKLGADLLGAILDQPDSPFYSLARVVSDVMLIKDGDVHARLRNLVNKAFTPR